MPPAARGLGWHAAQGEMLGRLGDVDAAAAAFLVAADLAPTDPERRHLARRAATVAGGA